MLPRSRIAAAVAVFFLSYAIFLVIWIQVKPHYGNLLAHIAAPMAAWTTGTRLEKIEQGAELADITFSYYVKEGGQGRDVMLGVQVPVSNYSFNVPLTLALIAGLYAILLP